MKVVRNAASILVLFLAYTALGCSGPSASLRGMHVRQIKPDFNKGTVSMDLDIRFRLTNETSTAIPIPTHQARIIIDG